MSDAAIPGVSSRSSAAAMAAANRVPIQTLKQDDFIKILVTQMTSQDPMSPQKDTEFVAQMAQFSQLESSKDMTTTLESLRVQQDFVKANSLLGKRVEFDTGSNSAFMGTVTGVKVEKGIPLVEVGDKTFSLNEVVRVEQASIGRTYPN